MSRHCKRFEPLCLSTDVCAAGKFKTLLLDFERFARKSLRWPWGRSLWPQNWANCRQTVTQTLYIDQAWVGWTQASKAQFVDAHGLWLDRCQNAKVMRITRARMPSKCLWCLCVQSPTPSAGQEGSVIGARVGWPEFHHTRKMEFLGVNPGADLEIVVDQDFGFLGQSQ